MPSTTSGRPLTIGRAALTLLSVGFTFGADPAHGPRTDLQGDPLPAEAVARVGSGRLRHGRPVSGVAFSPDGKSLVSGGAGRLRVWDTASGRLRRTIPLEGYGEFAFTCTADGLVVANAPQATVLMTVQVFDAEGKVRSRAQLRRQCPVKLALSPDGKRLAVIGSDAVWLHDAATGREALRVPLGEKKPLAREAAFAPDGKSFALWDYNNANTVRLYDAGDGKELRALRHGEGHASGARFSPDGRWLVCLNAYPEACSVWDGTTGKVRQRPKGPGGDIQCAAFSTEGRYLAMAGQRGKLALWDLTAGKEVRRFATAAYRFTDLAFSPDGKALAAASEEGVIWLWDVASGRVLPGSADPAIEITHRLRFSADGRRLLGEASLPIAWGPLTGREARRYTGRPLPSQVFQVSPDETLIAVADVGDVRLWEAGTGKEVRVLKGHEGRVSDLLFLQGGRLASDGMDGTIRVWDVKTGRQLHKLTDRGDPMLWLTASSDGRWLAAATSLRGPRGVCEVLLWDLGTGREHRRLPLGREDGATQLAFSWDSRFLAAVGGRSRPGGPREIKVWDAGSGKEWRSFEGLKEWECSVAFSPDGRTLATGGFECSLCLWELATGRRRHAFAGHENQVFSVAFSPDGRLLASSSVEAPVYVWDMTGAHGPKRPAPAAAELGRCWDELAGEDAEAAFRAVRRLASSPSVTLPFLRERLKPAAAVPPERLRRLLADLDGADFAARRRAAAELEGLADAAATELRKELEKSPSAEARRALKRALDGLDTPTPARLRAIRSVEALEWMATPEAARLLDELARGAPGATLTAEAAAARDRLRKFGKTGAP
jgi:WD40 repeat protein